MKNFDWKAQLREPHAASILKKMVFQIVSADSITEAVKVYRKCPYPLLYDWTFIFSAPRGANRGFAVNRAFSSGAGVFGIFSDANVFVLDPECFTAMERNLSHSFRFDYSISLDTQVLSYIQKYSKDGRKGTQDFDEVLKFIVDPNVNCDTQPYLHENTLGDEPSEQDILASLTAWQTIRDLDLGLYERTGVLFPKNGEKAAKSEAVAILKDWKNDSRFATAKSYAERRLAINMLLLSKIVLIQWSSKGQSLKQKLAKFCEFMDGIGAVAICFTRIATEFFTHGTNCPFFRKIQTGSSPKKIYENLKAMAWDLMHWQFAIDSFTSKLYDGAKVNFPAILTFDKAYLNLLECLALKAIALQKGNPEGITVYEGNQFGKGTEAFADEFVERFFNEDAVKKRQVKQTNNYSDANFKELLEAHLKLIYCQLNES
jgi:hypothetical protein